MIANGEIWSVADFQRCREVSQCKDFMVGRGLLACPDLGRQIKAFVNSEDYQPMNWADICHVLQIFFDITCDAYADKYMGNRLKQWLHYLRRQYPQAEHLFETIKRYKQKPLIDQAISESMHADFAQPA